MIYSTITKFAGLGLLFLVIAISGFALLTDKPVGISTEQNSKSVSVQHIAEPALVNSAETPVVKLASLSILTDYPATHDTGLKANVETSIEEHMISAKQLAAEQKYDEALRLLDIAPTTDQEEYSLSYLQAQIFSWSGQHEKAKQAFIDLRRQYPQDADIAVSFGYLHLYQENFEDAERLFSQVLDRFPGYHDAKQGLKRATAIQ